MWRLDSTVIALALFLIAIYSVNGLYYSPSGDCVPAKYIPWAVLHDHTVYLDSVADHVYGNHSEAYFVVRTENGHLKSYYPVLTPLLATPFYVPGYVLLGADGDPLDDPRFEWATALGMRGASIFFAVGAVVLFFLAARRVTDETWAFLLSLGLGLGTSMWTTASMALWQHGPAALFVSAILYAIVRDAREGWRHAPLAIIVASGLLFVNRPSDAPLVLPGLGYLAVRGHYSRFQLALGAAAVLLLLGGAVWLTGSPLAGYVDKASAFCSARFLEKVVYQFLDAQHGLLVYTPAVLLALPGIAMGLASARWRAFTAAALVGLAAFMVLIVCFSYTPGACYGPRYYTEAMPLVFFFICLGERWFRGPLGRIILILLFTISAGAQFYGAFEGLNRV